MPIIKTPKDLGAVIRNRRKELAWDQARLAAEVGASRQWVIDIEKGKPRAELDLALRALHALGLSLHTESPARKAPGSAPVNTPTPSIDINDVLNRHGPNRTLVLDTYRPKTALELFNESNSLNRISLDRMTQLTNPLPSSAADWLKKLDATTSSSQLAQLANPLSTQTVEWLKKPELITASSHLAQLTNPLPTSATDWLRNIDTTTSSQLGRMSNPLSASIMTTAVDPASPLNRLPQLSAPTLHGAEAKPSVAAPADSTPVSKQTAKPKKSRKTQNPPLQDDEER